MSIDKIKLGVFGIIEREGKILLGRRVGNDTSFPGKWCHPGGGIELGEKYEAALQREFKEEVGMGAWVSSDYIGVHEWITDSRHVVLIFMQVSSLDHPIAGDGFDKVEWFSFSEIESLCKSGDGTPLTITAATAFEVWINRQPNRKIQITSTLADPTAEAAAMVKELHELRNFKAAALKSFERIGKPQNDW